jgi:hypothetical protein
MRGSTVAGSGRLVITGVVDEFQIDIVVLRLSANTEAPSRDTGEDDANELSERRRVEGDNAISDAARGVLRVDAVARDRRLCNAANRLQPRRC